MSLFLTTGCILVHLLSVLHVSFPCSGHLLLQLGEWYMVVTETSVQVCPNISYFNISFSFQHVIASVLAKVIVKVSVARCKCVYVY